MVDFFVRHDGRAVDVWCAAVVLFAMVTGGMPFGGTGAEDIKFAIREMEPTFPGYLSSDIKVWNVRGFPVSGEAYYVGNQ